ncbi:MAG TPA: ATP-binding protein [Burkholderiales bacterium]|jgi:serine/threonine-protein kinase RsbW/sigma-B regulation protein RsbU (phosphoserine phosphatase)|nr:ATP-binding protein [Burkholderiales bacterium]
MTAVETTITNTLPSIAGVRERLAGIVAAHGVPRAVAAHMNIALDEALSNIIKHGYPDGGVHEIRLRLAVSEGMLIAEIEDDGVPFDPLNAPAPDIDAPLEQRPVGGLGVHFMRELMDEVAYTRTAGHNSLVLKKRLDNEKGDRNGTASA